MKKIYGIVILYKPSIRVVDNIKSYIDQVEKLYVMDNSPEKDISIIREIVGLGKKIVYKKMDCNQGIGKPINYVVKQLECNDDTWLLTMDQDSRFYNDTFKKYILELQDVKDNIYAISPFICLSNKVCVPKNKHKVKDKCLQSGAIFNLSICHKVGGFCEEYFIDCVDTEYCYRCGSMGYSLIECSSGILLHNLGSRIKSGLGRFFRLEQHNSLRRYYIVRNNLYMASKYPSKRIRIYLYLILGLVKIAMFDDDRKEKFKYAYLGWQDYKKNVSGEFLT